MSKRIRNVLLVTAIVLGAWISFGLVISKGRYLHPVGIRIERKPIGPNPHEAVVAALERKCPLAEFDTIVSAHPESRDFGLLLGASWRMTNYARVLLQHGADPSAYAQSLAAHGDSNTISLIQWVVADLKSSASNNAVEPTRVLSGASD